MGEALIELRSSTANTYVNLITKYCILIILEFLLYEIFYYYMIIIIILNLISILFFILFLIIYSFLKLTKRRFLNNGDAFIFIFKATFFFFLLFPLNNTSWSSFHILLFFHWNLLESISNDLYHYVRILISHLICSLLYFLLLSLCLLLPLVSLSFHLISLLIKSFFLI